MAEKPRTVGNAGDCVRRLRRVALKSQSRSSSAIGMYCANLYAVLGACHMQHDDY